MSPHGRIWVGTWRARRRGRRGFALPAAIMALVLLSALVAGALFVSTGELRAGRTDLADQRVLAAAEWALERTITQWDSRRNTALPVGGSEVVRDSVSPTGDRVVVTATRVQWQAFLLTAYATFASDGRGIPVRHTITASLRLDGVTVPAVAALTAAAAVTIDRGVVDGGDASPSTSDDGLCDNGASAVAGIAVPDTSLVCGPLCTGGPVLGVTGSPPVVDLRNLTSDSTAGIVGVLAPTVASRATVALPGGTRAPRPVVSGGECDRGDPLNWGDPGGSSRCADHYPVIHVSGSLTLAAGSVGQGVLVVDGSLRIEAGARFVGVVIVADDIAVTGAGAELLGAAFALDADRIGGTRVEDGGVIRRSSCALRRAVLGTSRVARVPLRWWSELR